MKRLFRWILLLSSACCLLPAAFSSVPDLTPLKKWVARQAEVRTVQADFVQKRSFRALRDPLATPGRLWFSAVQGFRWELGDPPRTIVLRKGKASLLIQPAKKHAEHLLAAADGSPGSPDSLPMMNFPLAKNFDDFNRQFEVLSVNVTGDQCHAELLPRDPQARKFLEAFRLDFQTENGTLLDFEIALRDGSTLRNDFSNVRLNGKIDAKVFDYDLTGYEVTDAKQ